MKKINLILLIMLFTAFSSMSQSVSLCDYKTDTLNYEQFKVCNEINILSDTQMKIISYDVVCRIGENDIYEFSGTGNSLPMHVKERLIYGGVKEFWLEKIVAKKEDVKVDIGTRKFFLTR